MTIWSRSTDIHKGKVIDRFEDGNGSPISDLTQQEGITIIFTDGSRIILGVDTYGTDSYISEYTK